MNASSPTGYNHIQNEIKTFLSSFGFKQHRTSTLFRTTENDLLQFISFQKGVSSLSNQMTINIVQKGLFVSGCSFDTLQPGNRIGQFMDYRKDKWWVCNESDRVKAGTAEIKEILQKDVMPVFEFSKDTQNLPELITSEKYKSLWCTPGSFVDKGFFFLKAKLYHEAIQCWENHAPSKVPRFKSIRNLIDQDQYSGVDSILEENIRLNRVKLKI